jgi:hypothetical protein
MDQRVVIGLVILVVAIAIVAVVVSVARKNRSKRLKARFGPEYDLAVQRRGNPSKAELELINREKRVNSFAIKPLTPVTRERFAEEWETVQRHFVDDPALAVHEADSLVDRVMAAKGYPMADWEQRASDVSVTYPVVVQNYRAACAIVRRYGQGGAGTEELRQAMVHYRSLFDELLGAPLTDAVIQERRAS